MAGSKNLKIPSSEQARKNGRKGGIARAKKAKEYKEMCERLKILSMLPSDKRKNMDKMDSACIAAFEEAEGGNVQALTFIRDTVGEKPVEKKKLSGDEDAPLTVRVVRFSDISEEI